MAFQARESAANDPLVRMGMRIRELRKALGLSQKQVGRALRITPQAVQKYETAQTHMTVARLFGLADVLGVSPAFLIDSPPADEPESDAGNHLREFRERSGLSQSALAEIVETSGQNISLLERGRSKLTVAMLVRLGRAFGCHPWALVEPQYEPPRPSPRPPPRHTQSSNAD